MIKNAAGNFVEASVETVTRQPRRRLHDQEDCGPILQTPRFERISIASYTTSSPTKTLKTRLRKLLDFSVATHEGQASLGPALCTAPPSYPEVKAV